ncbi:hypothetical protein ACRE_030550 [Hapsidospora chrysogenum ATCC 11550]|uniref:Uncharacterized protein n=1 Tax=Hapsidospora chrysogenum (strain ATCC 11550 / CBS 779.69 / DSM 880 / IAM 14645 / JCM 23072 / IMI 49137) TaxID=857340 RepID=A0A086T9R3_HAPC1|nr:hypothetical protein ACRE_030550 [Hapsidospora chrysogenum ATCC 11550]
MCLTCCASSAQTICTCACASRCCTYDWGGSKMPTTSSSGERPRGKIRAIIGSTGTSRT